MRSTAKHARPTKKLADNCINLLLRQGPLLNHFRLADNIVIIAGHQNTKSVYKG